MKVKEILMTKRPTVFTVRPEQSIEDAMQILAEHNVGVVLVVDDDEKLIGIVSERDIIREGADLGVALFGENISAIMSTNLIVASPDDEVSYLCKAMVEKNIRHMPVMEDDKLLDMVSIKDVVKAIQSGYEGEIHHLRYYVAENIS